ncbi:hypothetical protein [Streptomyces luteocolor]|uniref:hypothetical protein n=1 Tax=Streptomyces luteocolor TaxID=285500 RepID=UPI000853A647|nr:hypothetical protein [Streptomyces luteocolor]
MSGRGPDVRRSGRAVARTGEAVRRVRGRELPLAGGLALLITVLVVIAAAGPPLAERLAAEALGRRFAQEQRATPGVVHSARFDPEEPAPGERSDLGADLARYTETIENAAPRALRDGLVYDSTRIQLPTVKGEVKGGIALSLVYASDAPGRAAYVEGRAPRARERTVELAVSTRTRDALGLRVGQRIPLGDAALKNVDVVGRVVGVYRAAGERRLWAEKPLLARPLPGVAGAAPDVAALIAPRAAEVLQNRSGAELTVDWNMRVVAGPEVAGRFVGERGERAFHRAMARYPIAAGEDFCGRGGFGGKWCLIGTHPATELETSTKLPEAFDAFGGQWRQAAVVISFAQASLLGVGLAAAVVTALLAVRRRLGADWLIRARGASAAGVALGRAGWSAPSGALGYGAGCALAAALPGGSPAYGTGLAVAVLAWLLLPALTWFALRDRAVLRDREPRGAGRRLVVEALVVLLAAGGVSALRARGTEGTAGPDPLLAAVPVLLGLATVAVLVRCYPWPVRVVARWAARGRGAVALVALSRAAKEAPARGLALLVLVVTLAGAVFGGLVSGTLEEGRRAAAAWQVGADASFLGAGRDPGMADRLARARGVRDTVTVRQLRVDPVSGTDGGRYGIASLIGVDGAELRKAAGDSRAARALTDAGLTRGGTGREIRVLASEGHAGDLLTYTRYGKTIRLRVTGHLPQSAARDAALGPVRGATVDRQRLLLADNRDLKAFKATDFEETALLLYGRNLDAEALRSLVPRAAPGANTGDLRIRAEEEADAADDGLIAAVTTAHTACTALAVLLALLALVLELLLSAPARGRTTAHLRTLGLGGRAASGLQLLQLLPMVLAAVAGGVALGLTLPSLLGPALDLREFTGGPTAPDRHVDALFTAALGAGLCVLVAAAVGVETWLGRRRGLGAVLRLGRADD